ncbi:MAG TPA: SDR family NAD(P)-dependent oxidoreductase [Terriglobales bacterium]|nr:SDR family NAD(P)-dependent oxidoreductase [Terriglobales bacterium]
MSLDGRVALVTGGSRGIGAATVKMLVAAGAKVAFNYQQAKSAADSIVASCGTDNCVAVQCDLASVAAAQTLVAATVKKFGRLDILVANHGIWPPEDVAIEKMSEEQWRRTLAVNLDSVFGLVKYSVAQMKAQPRQSFATGHVVLVSSTAGQRGEAFHCDYAASKGALISMVKGLSTELAPDGIYVNCVAPGWVETDMSLPILLEPAARDTVLSKIPLARVGKPEEIAAPILFVCTEHAGFITGEIFNVNGGAVLVG